MTQARISLGRKTHRVEALILTIRQEVSVTIEIKVRLIEDVFTKNDLAGLDRSTYGKTITLSVADWIAKRAPQDAALSEVLHFVYGAIREHMGGHVLWLLVGDTSWQNDTRIVQYRKKFNSLKAQGIEMVRQR